MIIQVEKVNEVYLRFFSNPDIESEIVDYFTFDYPGARFTPQYKARKWDGKIRLADKNRKTLYFGLYPYLERFATQHGYEIEHLNLIHDINSSVSYEQVSEYVKQLSPASKGQEIPVRDYQLHAVYTGLKDNRCVLLSPTGSGKSLIIYLICRWHIERGRKCIIVVPTTSLVEQLYSDFKDYSTVNGWDVNGQCQKLYSGFPKEFTKSCLLTTWQSAYTMPKPWFQQFDVVVGDECHQFKAKSLTTIMERLEKVKYRIGTTGSLDNTKINQLVLEGIFGSVHKVTSTTKLISENKLAPLKVTSILLKYPEEVRQQCTKFSYQDEINFLVQNEKRNKFIRNLALSSKGNTLLLFLFVEKHGAVLYEMLQAKDHTKDIFFIHGGTDVEDRENVRTILSQQSNAIVVASYGVFSTGINIPSISNIIFASPSKSRIRNLQSIGRGLRIDQGKTHCNLYDLTDDLHWNSWKNFTLKHGAERFKLYLEENFPVQLIEVTL